MGTEIGSLSQIVVVVLSVVELLAFQATAPLARHHDMHLLNTTLSFLANLGLFPLVCLENTQLLRPAKSVVMYLLASSACNVLTSGLPTFSDLTPTGAILLATALSLKTVLIAMECHKVEVPLQIDKRSLLSKVFFGWINPILIRGFQHVLVIGELPPIDQSMSSEYLRRRAFHFWDQRVVPETRWTLPTVITNTVWPELMGPILPRLALIALRYAQPVLISTAIRRLKQPPVPSGQLDLSVPVMALLVYVGIAVSSAMYQDRLNRLRLMIRSASIGLINSKSFVQAGVNADESSAVALMSSEADSVSGAAGMLHGIWSRTLEVIIGMTMLARTVGWVWPVPLVIIFFCSRMSRYLAKNLRSKQKDWRLATQVRIAATVSMLNSMKSLRMIGLISHIEQLVHRKRLQEVATAKKVRWMMVAYNASANALGIFSPIVTFVLYALYARISGSGLDVETAFTVTALLGLVTHPANMIMSTVPQIVGSLAAFEGIQQYLLQPPRDDQRQTGRELVTNAVISTPAIILDRVEIRRDASSTPLLEEVTFSLARGSICMCCGPVGSGKSLLIRAILGEASITSGSITISSMRIACCDQSPWLPSGTLKNAVCGYSPLDELWYDEVMRLCCLEEDLVALPEKSDTLIGSRGVKLSGGQRHRVALARALYARCEIVLIDDSFSALDGKTEAVIIANLFGPNGHFKRTKTTVLYTSSSASHGHLTDWILIVDDGTVSAQGTWPDVQNLISQSSKIQARGEKPVRSPNDGFQTSRNKNQPSALVEADDDLTRATGDLSLYGRASHPQLTASKY